jgi:hypothetical protein
MFNWSSLMVPRSNRRKFIKTGLIFVPSYMAARAAVVSPGPIMRTLGSSAFVANAVDFAGDGQCWFERDADWTGSADNKFITVSLWFRKDGNDGVASYMANDSGGRIQIAFTGGNNIRVAGSNAAGGNILDIRSAASFTASATWHHLFATADMANAANRAVYVDGVSDISAVTYTDDTIDWTVADHSIGAEVGGTGSYNGCLAEVWITNAYLDVATNLTKFRSAGGAPVNLGADGSIPTGSPPLVYLKNPAASYATNSGSGGNISKKGTTALTDASTHP